MGTETNAFNRGSYCREASVGKVKYFFSLLFAILRPLRIFTDGVCGALT